MSTRLADLLDLREVLQASILATPPDKRAPLAGQLRGTLAEIEALESRAAKVGDPVDELASRRVARGAGTASDQGGAVAIPY